MKLQLLEWHTQILWQRKEKQKSRHLRRGHHMRDGEALTIYVIQNCPESFFQKFNALVQLSHHGDVESTIFQQTQENRLTPASVHPRQNPSGHQRLDTMNGSRNYDAYTWQQTHIGGTAHLPPGDVCPIRGPQQL